MQVIVRVALEPTVDGRERRGACHNIHKTVALVPYNGHDHRQVLLYVVVVVVGDSQYTQWCRRCGIDKARSSGRRWVNLLVNVLGRYVPTLAGFFLGAASSMVPRFFLSALGLPANHEQAQVR